MLLILLFPGSTPSGSLFLPLRTCLQVVSQYAYILCYVRTPRAVAAAAAASAQAASPAKHGGGWGHHRRNSSATSATAGS